MNGRTTIDTISISRRTILASSLSIAGTLALAGSAAADAVDGFVHVSGSRLFYRAEGKGEPLLLIAGFSCDHVIWDALAPLLAQRYRVIRFDNRGIGHSAHGADLANLSTQLMAQDATALADKLDIDRMHIVGHSMGGQIAQELTLQAPDRVATLSLLSSWAKSDAKLAWLIRLFGDLAPILDAEHYPRALLPWMFTDEAFNAAPKAMDDAARQWATNPLRPSAAVLQAQAHAILATDTTKRLRDIRTSTAVMVAAGDALTPPRLSRQLVDGIHGATYAEITTGGHAFILDAAPKVADRLLAFLAAHPIAG